MELRHSWDLIPSAAAANLGGGTQGTQGKPRQIQLFFSKPNICRVAQFNCDKATAVLCKKQCSTLGSLCLANLLLDAGQNFFFFPSFLVITAAMVPATRAQTSFQSKSPGSQNSLHILSLGCFWLERRKSKYQLLQFLIFRLIL